MKNMFELPPHPPVSHLST